MHTHTRANKHDKHKKHNYVKTSMINTHEAKEHDKSKTYIYIYTHMQTSLEKVGAEKRVIEHDGKSEQRHIQTSMMNLKRAHMKQRCMQPKQMQRSTTKLKPAQTRKWHDETHVLQIRMVNCNTHRREQTVWETKCIHTCAKGHAWIERHIHAGKPARIGIKHTCACKHKRWNKRRTQVCKLACQNWNVLTRVQTSMINLKHS